MVLRPLAGLGGTAMELFTQLFGDVLAFVYHCFDRIVIYGYLSGLSRPEQVVHFFRNVVGVAAVSKEVLSRRKPRTGALGIACTQADTPTFECVLLDHLGHQDLQFHPEEYGSGTHEEPRMGSPAAEAEFAGLAGGG